MRLLLVRFQRSQLVEMSYLFLLLFCFYGATREHGISSFENMNEIYSKQSRSRLKRGTMEICNSTSCKTATSKLLFLLNYEVEPCEEFPEYVCGNQDSLQSQFPSETLESFEKNLNFKVDDNSEKYHRDFRVFHQTCLDFHKDLAFLDTLKFVSEQNYGNLTDTLVEVILRQSFSFFDIGLDIDAETQRYVFQITLPGESVLKTTTDGWSLREQIKNQCAGNFQDSMTGKVIKLDELNANFTKCEKETMEKYLGIYGANQAFFLNISDTEDLVKQLLSDQQAIQLPADEIRESKTRKKFTAMSIAELNKKYDMVNWTHFFESITTETFSEKEIIQVYFPKYLQKVFDFFKSLEERKLIGMLQGFSSLQLYKNILEPYENDRKAFCMSLVHQLMPDVASIRFYEQNQLENNYFSVNKSNILFINLKKLLNESLEQSSLDNDTKLTFQQKLDRLKLGLIPSGNLDVDKNNYKDINVGLDFEKNLVEIMRNYRKIIFSHVGTKASASSLLNYFVSPFQDMPQTFYSSDTIVLHPGIFNRVPSDLPDYMIAAKLGFLLAQQIVRHFDPIGRLHMTTKSSQSSNKIYKALVERTKSLLDSVYLKDNPIYYHGTSAYFPNINGTHLSNELIIDNAAFRLITDYYKTLNKHEKMPWIHNEITPEQVFLIAVTQEFCGQYSEVELMRDIFERGSLPFPIKIQNMVSNSAFFTENFECRKGSAMSLQPEVTVQFPDIDSDDDISNDEEESKDK